MKRVTLTGPECCGKTTTAASLAEYFDTIWTEEYARIYAEEVDRELTAADVEPIARGEMKLIEDAITSGEDLIIHDTDLLSTIAYAEYYYCEPPGWVVEELHRNPADLYLLFSHLPMKADGVRDPNLNRNELREIFIEHLTRLDRPWYALQPPFEPAAIDLITRLVEDDRSARVTSRRG